MPMYEYECRNCKERFEVLQKMGEGNEGLCCPKCNSDNPEKIFSAFCSGTSKGHLPLVLLILHQGTAEVTAKGSGTPLP
jgi:putative FmdB family regulatory protein